HAGGDDARVRVEGIFMPAETGVYPNESTAPPMKLRPLSLDDLTLYQRVYTDPQMWTELGGVPELDLPAKLGRDVASVEADRHWVLVIVTEDGTAAGTVSL